MPWHPILCLLNLIIKSLSLHFANLWGFFFQFIFLVIYYFYKIMRNSWPLNNMSSNCIDPLTCWFFSVNMTTVLHDLVSWILRCRTTDIKLYLNFNCSELAPLTWTLSKGQLYMKDWNFFFFFKMGLSQEMVWGPLI